MAAPIQPSQSMVSVMVLEALIELDVSIPMIVSVYVANDTSVSSMIFWTGISGPFSLLDSPYMRVSLQFRVRVAWKAEDLL
jgi:hypothetical protein